MFVFVFFLLRTTAHTACRDCAQPVLGGPAENRFTAFDPLCRGDACREPGFPQVYVNLSNLTLYLKSTDLGFGPAPGFTLDRSFNSDDTSNGPFGPGWSFNLGESLSTATDGSVVIHRGSGPTERFAPSAPGATAGNYFPVTPTADTLAQNSDGSYTLRSAAVSQSFSSDGRLLSISDASVSRVSLDYDSSAHITAAHYRGRTVKFTYSGSRISAIADDAGRTVSYSYTDSGRLAQQTNADGSAVSYQYDDGGNLTAVTYAGGTIAIAYTVDPPFTSVASVTTPDGAVRQYDTPFSPVQIRLTDGNGDASLYTSNTNGLLQSVSDPNGNTISYSYDASGRRTRVVNGAGETATFTYDAKGNLTNIVDSGNNKWQADYTAAGGIAHLTDPNGNVWTFRYDSTGALTGLTNPLAGAYTVTRNASGQISSLTDPAGNKSTYTYNADGLLATWVDALGGSWAWQYDGAARPSGLTDPGGTAVSATYSAGGHLASATSGSATTNFDYSGIQRDTVGRLVAYTDSYGNKLAYQYDAAGLLTGITLPGGKGITYQYDHGRRLIKVADSLGDFAVYRYDAAGSPVSVTVSGGPVTIYQYDGARRLRAIVSTGPDGLPVAAYRYTTDNNGNRTAVNALEPSSAVPAVTPVSFTFDAARHPVSRADGATLRYDSAGRLIAIQGSRAASFTYDPYGRVVGFAADSTTTYSYDPTGLRTSRVVNGAERRFVYDLSAAAPRVVMETDGANTPVAWNVYGLGLLWKITADGTPYFYHFDGDGNTVALSNPSKGVVNQYRYDPEGRLATSNETVENAFRAHGETGWIDDGNGLIFTNSAFLYPELRIALPATIDLSPPAPTLFPPVTGAGACFIDGVATCTFARRER